MSKSYLFKNNELRKGDFLESNNGLYKAYFQGDSNFVIYGWKAVWASNTVGQDVDRLIMQGDCNLVMYSQSNTARWHTNSVRPEANMCHLQLTDEGKLVVSRDAEEVWNSAHSHGVTV